MTVISGGECMGLEKALTRAPEITSTITPLSTIKSVSFSVDRQGDMIYTRIVSSVTL